MVVREVSCATALSRSGLPGLDYALNPYTGCGHACIYCYAPSTLRYSGPEAWGTFVNAKVDVARRLERELRMRKRGVVGIGTVTDPYQPAEARLGLTRGCLEVLLAKDFPVCIQTKSPLVARDVGLIREFRDVEVGFTVTTLENAWSAVIEPGAPGPQGRLDGMRRVAGEGIRTWAFVGPIVPGILDGERLREVLVAVREAGAGRVLIDRLRLKPGLWARMEPELRDKAPGVAAACRKALFQGDGTFEALRAVAVETCREIGLPIEPGY